MQVTEELKEIFSNSENSSIQYIIDSHSVSVYLKDLDKKLIFLEPPEKVLEEIISLEDDARAALGDLPPMKAAVSLFEIHLDESLEHLNKNSKFLHFQPTGVELVP